MEHNNNIKKQTNQTKNMYLKLIDTVYFFNTDNKIISTYKIEPHGFIYSVCRYSDSDFERIRSIISGNVLSKRLTDVEFFEFCSMLNSIQENSNSLKQITSFEEHFKSLRETYKIQLKPIN